MKQRAGSLERCIQSANFRQTERAHTHTHVHTRSQTEEERGGRKKGEDTNEKYQVSEEEIRRRCRPQHGNKEY